MARPFALALASSACVLALGSVVCAQTAPPAAQLPAPAAAAAEQTVVPEKVGVSRIEIMFVLDTTGSMSGLIEGAKKKIWSIASAAATAKQHPQVLMGLIGYRDRGDSYVTTVTPLTEDLDSLYSKLMEFSAGGGGDEPESVNQALAEALSKAGWSTRAVVKPGAKGPSILQIIYLVGDAPPHMDYKDDVKYPETCTAAATRGIVINAIQCGAIESTKPVWKAIAASAEGEYFQIEQSGGVKTIPAPQDEELARLEGELEGTLIDYGDRTVMAEQKSKREMQDSVTKSAAPAAAADRAMYNATAAGARNLYGRQELVQDVREKKVQVKDVPKDQLPASMQTMTVAEREAFVEAQAAKREAIRVKMAELATQRGAFLRAALSKVGGDSFDKAVVESLRRQAGRRGIEIPEGK